MEAIDAYDEDEKVEALENHEMEIQSYYNIVISAIIVLGTILRLHEKGFCR